MKKNFLSFLSTLVVISLCVISVSAESSIDEIKAGQTVDVAFYNVVENTYETGTMKVDNKTNEFGKYRVLNEQTFKKAGDDVSYKSKLKMQKIVTANEMALQERVSANATSYDRFGNIDSDCWNNNATIAPYTVSHLHEMQADTDNNMWLAVGDKKGKILKVYMTLADDDIANSIDIKVVTPKRMSIRLEDGTILNNGDSFKLAEHETIRFQMCSNNWDNDIYDDESNGLAGTVVYSVSLSDKFDERSYDSPSHSFILPKGDPVLRTDTNKCFMAYRFHFAKGDYNKQTGITKVVNTPTESLSVNLPLGSTIQADAYKSFKQIDTDNVFIAQGSDLTLSYTDYQWNH